MAVDDGGCRAGFAPCQISADLLWLSTGPGLLTRCFAEMLATGYVSPATWLRSIVVLTRYELGYCVAEQCLAGYKTTSRNWFRAAFAGPVAQGAGS